ncbi:tumor necrosis factor ligand superfamily member 14 [Syngnathus scovelli]|uniref:tumor necrosis factor ligand superfamily member 14 n=1 Tax=Syngnathus scovelli TaxID=161590 RepID=UPI0021100681|nr:tumor necrosis factor ligand superfamily member 14 [Syngnathus scovelli]
MRHRPSVYFVDSHTGAPPLPPRAGPNRQYSSLAKTLLFVLVSLALTGLVVEALLIFYLHSSQLVGAPSMSFSKLTAEKSAFPPTSTRHSPTPEPLARQIETNASRYTTCKPCFPLSKPVARLIGGKDVVHGKGFVGWSLISDSLLRGMDYKDGSLLIRREGFYFVYCKLSFRNHRVFHHTVEMRTRRHSAGAVVLLQARKYSSADGNISNSFLGGVFHLHKDDTLFVKVSDTSKIVQVIAYESIFGAFMI